MDEMVWPAPSITDRVIRNTYIDFVNYRITSCAMKLGWDENKRKSNLAKHGLDFADLARFDIDTALFAEDTRLAYPERRFVALGLLNARLVQVVYAKAGDGWRVISLRPASRKERKLWLEK